jgi:ribulose-phosphate 3-epimerase
MLLLNKLDQKKLNFFFRYCLIGFVSISIELLLRKLLLEINSKIFFFSFVPLVVGIIFAFICNVTFNFKIPRYYYKRSFFYFSIISISSFTFQYFLSKFILFQSFNYEFTRFFISGTVFLIAYNFHIKYSFAKNKKVGVAIYLDNKENIEDIFNKVGFYPDYIHVDFVDKTMNSNVDEPDFNKFLEIKKKWPNHRIESHIMSKKPSKYIDKFATYSDVIYFHYEIDENKETVKELINNHKIKSGLVLHASNEYKNIISLVDSYKEILVLCIEKPGESGQEFIENSNNLIDKINNLKTRSKFNLCVDGGLSQKNIIKIDCEKIVSASNVFKNINPKKQIKNLQKLLNN